LAQDKITFEQFIEAVDANNKLFVEDLHKYLLDNGCKVVFEEKNTQPPPPPKSSDKK